MLSFWFLPQSLNYFCWSVSSLWSAQKDRLNLGVQIESRTHKQVFSTFDLLDVKDPPWIYFLGLVEKSRGGTLIKTLSSSRGLEVAPMETCTRYNGVAELERSEHTTSGASQLCRTTPLPWILHFNHPLTLDSNWGLVSGPLRAQQGVPLQFIMFWKCVQRLD